MFLVPTFQNVSTRYIITTDLNGSAFRLRFHWNSREAAWYMDILNTDDVLILSGIKLVVNYSLIRQYPAIQELPKGEFILFDLEANDQTGGVTIENFGRRYQLLFFTDEEIEAGGI